MIFYSFYNFYCINFKYTLPLIYIILKTRQYYYDSNLLSITSKIFVFIKNFEKIFNIVNILFSNCYTLLRNISIYLSITSLIW